MKERFKKLLKKFFLIDDTPHKIAAGAALGIFFGIAPGEGVATTLIFASLFRFNRLAATAGVLAVNMWTTVLVLPVAASVGAYIFRESYTELVRHFHQANGSYLQLFFSKIIFFNVTLPLLVGFLAVAGAIAIIFYVVLYFFLIRYGKKKSKKYHMLMKNNNLETE